MLDWESHAIPRLGSPASPNFQIFRPHGSHPPGNGHPSSEKPKVGRKRKSVLLRCPSSFRGCPGNFSPLLGTHLLHSTLSALLSAQPTEGHCCGVLLSHSPNSRKC